MPAATPPLNAQRSGAAPEEISAAAKLFLAAQRPVMFVGHGVTLSEASEELTELAHRLHVPVISSPNGFGCLDMTDPLSLGFIGRNGCSATIKELSSATIRLSSGRTDTRCSSISNRLCSPKRSPVKPGLFGHRLRRLRA